MKELSRGIYAQNLKKIVCLNICDFVLNLCLKEGEYT